MGENFDANREFTVEELLSFNLGAHADIINTVYAAAVSEFAIEQQLVKIRKMWVEREFKLAKHIPESVYKGTCSAVTSRTCTLWVDHIVSFSKVFGRFFTYSCAM